MCFVFFLTKLESPFRCQAKNKIKLSCFNEVLSFSQQKKHEIHYEPPNLLHFGFLQIPNDLGTSCMWIRTYTFIIYKTFPEDESLLSSSLVFLSRIMPILVNPILSFNLRLCVFIFYKEFAFLSIQCAFYRGFVHVTLLHSLSY